MVYTRQMGSLKPMFYITGNNDSLAGNYQPFELEGKSPLNFAQDWTGACVHCKGLIIDGTHMHHSGYYSSYVMPHNKDIILIALNSTQWVQTPMLAARYPNQDKDARTVRVAGRAVKEPSCETIINSHAYSSG